jgi:hypothetical protein
MNRKIFTALCFSATLLVFPAVNGEAQQAVDQYGFGQRAFLIQSALESGKSANGLWDVPGKPGEAGNFKYDSKKDWSHMGVWQREKGDPKDRLFSFSPAQGSAAGRYFIKFARDYHWGVNAIEMTGKIEARSRADHFELKNVGGDRWKIYYKPGVIVCLDKPTAKNGTKLVLRSDHSGAHTEWVFFDAATSKSFIPVAAPVVSAPVIKTTLAEALRNQDAAGQYFRHADAGKFNSENASGEVQSYLNGIAKPTEQWNAIKRIVDSACNNKDMAAKRSMLKALSEVQVKPGGNFGENLLKGALAKQLGDMAGVERDAESKTYLNRIKDGFR